MTPATLVARVDNAGDVLLTGPAVRAIAADRPVVMLSGPRGREAALMLPGVERVLTHHIPWIDACPDPVGRASFERLVGDLAATGADRALIFTSFHQSPLPLALAMRLAGIGEIGAISDDYPGSLLDVRHRVPDDVHEVERALSLAAAMGHRLPDGDDGRLAVTGVAGADPAGIECDGCVVVHPGATAPARTWAPARWAELVGELLAAGHRVAVTGTAAERPLTAAVAGGRDGVVDLGGRTTLRALARVLAGARAVVCGNTGPAHLAAAVGCPVVSLYAPTIPLVRWRPWMVPAALLFRDVPCAGCRARTCPVAGHPCLGGVSAAEVVEAIAAVTSDELAVA